MAEPTEPAPKPFLVGYARVSMADQNCQRQIDELIRFGVDERELIVERSQHGLKMARERGVIGGRPEKMTAEMVEKAVARVDAKEANVATRRPVPMSVPKTTDRPSLRVDRVA